MRPSSSDEVVGGGLFGLQRVPEEAQRPRRRAGRDGALVDGAPQAIVLRSPRGEVPQLPDRGGKAAAILGVNDGESEVWVATECVF